MTGHSAAALAPQTGAKRGVETSYCNRFIAASADALRLATDNEIFGSAERRALTETKHRVMGKRM
jgi:hypothetical protein